MAAHPTVKKIMYRIKRSPLRNVLPLQYSYALNKLDTFQVPELGIAFIPNPKAANRSIKLAIDTRLNPQFRGDPHNANWQ